MDLLDRNWRRVRDLDVFPIVPRRVAGALMGRAPAPLPQFGLEQLLVEALRNLRGTLGWVDVDGGFVEIGHTGDAFAFDNEEPPHRVWLEPNRLADRLVTNGEWLEFITDGGYRRPELRLPDGLAKARAEG